MKGITENRPCGAFRPAGNGESLPGGILPLKKRELRGPPGTIYGIRRGNISSNLKFTIIEFHAGLLPETVRFPRAMTPAMHTCSQTVTVCSFPRPHG